MMNRRDTIKSLLLGSVAVGLTVQGCAPKEDNSVKEQPKANDGNFYGRTPEEAARDKRLQEEVFFNDHELETIAVLCDIILPKNDEFGSASDAKVPDFIEFIVKDMPYHQMPIRGGIMWLDNYCNKNYDKEFKKCSNTEQLAVCDLIAYPKKTLPEHKQGEKFFTKMRNLTLTGYFTSKMGIQDLGYKGNTPNVWDGVPEDVLKAHGFEYDAAWLAKCVDQSKRGDLAKWDDDGNLIS
ncbi:gluconate 2-dehydrogenase subunit 3 family protein [Aureibaculum sp. 2210JD6-5]|uniref:gluconate 2-dehydrogenase subunit 3 family protein n=1 Tax=Aureibaculum sp. 2210JD6-5 TaxID=3103957 RepID=UPI002AACFFA7|nr:gluconate 2-dehydrogenase subunit 3 family protein [Aureibaculum sp. 2210JD6-5]MDY7395168.1 gluconate 2-dehydrogenase subunit 3 family protein [Aureibaculum sp. 2210JD6-5]